jgi:hypothetical protein
LAYVFLVGITGLLLSMVVRTYKAPLVPPLAEMSGMTVANPRLTERCESSGTGAARTTTCYWRLRLDNSETLAWPWPDPTGGVKSVDSYLRKAAPLRVRFWEGTVFEITDRDGNTFLDYTDAAAWERSRQVLWLFTGAVVVVSSTVRVGLELSRLRSDVDYRRSERCACWLDGISVAGALLQFLVGRGRTWHAVVFLGLFAGVADLLGRRVTPPLGSTCEPSR